MMGRRPPWERPAPTSRTRLAAIRSAMMLETVERLRWVRLAMSAREMRPVWRMRFSTRLSLNSRIRLTSAEVLLLTGHSTRFNKDCSEPRGYYSIKGLVCQEDELTVVGD